MDRTQDLLNYRLFQKLKLSRNGKFNHLTIILTYNFLTYQKKKKKKILGKPWILTKAF